MHVVEVVRVAGAEDREAERGCGGGNGYDFCDRRDVSGGADEWQVCVEDRDVAVLRDGRPAPRNTASRNLYYPLCFRDSSEIRRPAPAVPEPSEPALRVDATPAVRRPAAPVVRRGRSL